MSRFYRTGLTLCCLFALAVPPASAATLAELLQAAQARSPAAAQWQEQAQQREAEAEAAGRWFPDAPELSVTGHTDQWNDDVGQREWEVEVGAPLWRPGQRGHQREAADLQRTRWQTEQRVLQLELAGQVREAVWDLQESATRHQLAQQQVAIAEQLEQDVNRRVQAGELARADSLLAQGDTLNAHSEADTARQQWRAAQARLNLLTGASDQAIQAQEQAADLTPERLTQHPRIQAALQELATARSDVQVTKDAVAAPSASVIWKQDRDTAEDEYARTLGLKFTVPLGAKGRNRPEVAAARASVRSADTTLQQIRNEVQQEIDLAQAALTQAEQQRARAERQNELAQQNLLLSRRAFDAGELDLLSLLKLQGNALDASENRELNIIAHHRAIARFNQALGVLP